MPSHVRFNLSRRANISYFQFTPVILFISFAVLFGISTQTTISTWLEYAETKRIWDKTSKCKIVKFYDEDAEICKDKGEEVTIKVTLEAKNNKQFRAFENDDRIKCYSGDALEKVKEQYQIDQTKKCYYHDKGDEVLFSEGGFDSKTRSQHLMRAILTTVCTIVFGLIMLFFLRRSVMVLFASQTTGMRGMTEAATGVRGVPFAGGHVGDNGEMGMRRRGLSARDAQSAVAAFREHESPSDDATCPICLEELTAADAGRSTRLPCKHLYHEECALQWLMKGNPSCPYCFYDLSDDITRLRNSSSVRREDGSGDGDGDDTHLHTRDDAEERDERNERNSASRGNTRRSTDSANRETHTSRGAEDTASNLRHDLSV